MGFSRWGGEAPGGSGVGLRSTFSVSPFFRTGTPPRKLSTGSALRSRAAGAGCFRSRAIARGDP